MAYEQIITVSGSASSGQIPQADGNGGYTWATPAAGVSPSSATPAMDGTGAVGTSADYARGDHVHPTDTSRAPLASPTFTGTPSAPTAAAGTNTTQLATTAFVTTAVANKSVPTATTTTPKMDGTAAVGSETKWAKGDHVHPTDTSRAPLASPALTGTPTAPTATAGTNTTQIATTAFVGTAVDDASGTIVTVNVPVSAWSNGSATVTCTGVTATSNIVVTSDPSTYAVAAEAGVYCSAQGANSLTFSSLNGTPSGNITMNVWIGTYVVETLTYAPLASPAFTGVPTAPTATSGTSTTQIATTQFVATAVNNGTAALAPKASPALTGTPTAPTAVAGTSTTQIATTAFVTTALANAASKMLKVMTSSISSLPVTISNSAITSDMEVIGSQLSDPSAQNGDWTITTSNGSLTISGTISGTTTVTLYLSEVQS